MTTPGGRDRSLAELAGLFVRLGASAFGGPAAHIAMMHDEVVRRRRWMDDQRFLDMVGATNLVPGPNSTEMAMHVGHDRGGWRGLVIAGMGFILPAAVIVVGVAWVYVRYGATPTGEALLWGVKPVVLAIILQALVGLGRTAVRSGLSAVVGLAVAGLFLVGVNELLLLAGGALAMLGVRGSRRRRPPSTGVVLVGAMAGPAGPLLLQATSVVGPSVDLVRLFGLFLKVGGVLYGSGYVLLAFLRRDLVERLAWLTDAQLLDAVTVGQVTPGPVFTTATFVGYVLAGLPGAVVATTGIFLPSFLFAGALSRLLPLVRERPWTGDLLDGVNVAALGLMAGVVAQLASGAIVDPLTVLLAVATGLALWRSRLNSTWLVLGGAVVGVVASALGAGP